MTQIGDEGVGRGMGEGVVIVVGDGEIVVFAGGLGEGAVIISMYGCAPAFVFGLVGSEVSIVVVYVVLHGLPGGMNGVGVDACGYWTVEGIVLGE